MTSGPRERILVADGDPDARAALARAVDRLGCDVVLASTPEEALSRMRDTAPVVILAAHRPGFDGASVLHRRDAAPHAVRVLVTHDRDHEINGRGEPVNGFLRFVAEPFEPRNLEEMVREGLRLYRVEQEYRELGARLDQQLGRMQNRQKLLDAVVVERTKEIHEAYEKLRSASRQAIQALAEAIEARDPYTKGHCARVAAYAVGLARETRYPDKEIETLEFAAFLHDVGKIGVRDGVLLKPGPLDEDEWKHMRIHPMVGYEIAVKLDMLRPLVSCIRNHHERWDGKGYPDGLVGDAIPIIARIVGIADAFDAMATDRPYKPALTLDDSIAAFRRQRGVMFDPQLTDLFIERVIGELKVS